MARNYRYVVEALSAKHARLQGAVARDCPDKATYMADLQHVEHVIRMYAPDWQPSPPVNPRRPAILGSYGAMIRGALDVLRTADRPLTTFEIAREIVARHTKAQPSDVKAVAGSIHMGLRARVGKGVVMIEGFPARWALERILADLRLS
ncbi:MAG: hypothetical protein ABI668_05015 [Sphingorhabdus sp.]